MHYDELEKASKLSRKGASLEPSWRQSAAMRQIYRVARKMREEEEALKRKLRFLHHSPRGHSKILYNRKRPRLRLELEASKKLSSYCDSR